jgi:2,4-dienoyl-CoA reductase-like NADH-dependent reductase (Old Yellow Enzyme family)
LALEVAAAVRAAWSDALPLFMRISAIDWVENGWQIEDSVELARHLRPLGVDLVDCSSGALVPYAKIEACPGYQVPFAERVRRESGILTGAVGLITEARQADAIIRREQADMVLLAREFLRDPYWPLHAAKALGGEPEAPRQYSRAFV